MKVLVADDESVSRRLLESSLTRWGYSPVVAKDGLEASQVPLSPDAPKLAVIDWLMPGIDGAQLGQSVRRNKPEPYTYIIMLTGKRNQDDVIRGLEAGADDYVTKPFNPSELKVRLRTGKRILYLQDQLICAREALRDQATRDQLTGVWNRATIMGILTDELARSRRETSSVGIAMADLDYFKSINDTHGHPVGDEMLRQVSRAMQDVTRRYDSIGRYGGEEFLIVLPGCDESNAISHAQRLRTAVSRVRVRTPQGEIGCTMSLGVSISSKQSYLEAGDMIEIADAALYAAKRAGRDRVELGQPALAE